MSSNVHTLVESTIAAEFHMFSGCEDTQTSADVSNVEQFQLPDPAGRAGGACTSALLQTLYQEGHAVSRMSWTDVLHQMRIELNNMGFQQIPQLSSSRKLDIREPMYIVPPGSYGRRRALLIGINYVGQEGQLSGCHNDLMNIKNYLEETQGFEERDMLILMDDGYYHQPTKKNILEAFRLLTEYSQPGDVAFVHYSGHGGRVRDTGGDEEDGHDETIIPVDFRMTGQIKDDEVYTTLVLPMKKDVHCTVLMDCCHSGSVLDLPYSFKADEGEMSLSSTFNFFKLNYPSKVFT